MTLGVRLCGSAVRLTQLGCVIYSSSYVCCPRQASGESMLPTIHPLDIVLSETITPLFSSFKRNDIVIVQNKDDPHQILCKRLVAMERERVFNETTGHYVQVPKGHVWIEGDNKARSADSRVHGPFPLALVRERVYLTIPVSKLMKR